MNPISTRSGTTAAGRLCGIAVVGRCPILRRRLVLLSGGRTGVGLDVAQPRRPHSNSFGKIRTRFWDSSEELTVVAGWLSPRVCETSTELLDRLLAVSATVWTDGGPSPANWWTGRGHCVRDRRKGGCVAGILTRSCRCWCHLILALSLPSPVTPANLLESPSFAVWATAAAVWTGYAPGATPGESPVNRWLTTYVGPGVAVIDRIHAARHGFLRPAPDPVHSRDVAVLERALWLLPFVASALAYMRYRARLLDPGRPFLGMARAGQPRPAGRSGGGIRPSLTDSRSQERGPMAGPSDSSW